MTRLLEQAFATASELPDEEQDEIAALVLAAAGGDVGSIPPPDNESRGAIAEGRAQARRGEFVSDGEIAAIWKRYGA